MYGEILIALVDKLRQKSLYWKSTKKIKKNKSFVDFLRFLVNRVLDSRLLV